MREMQHLFAVLPLNLDSSQVCAAKGFASEFISRVYGCTKTDRSAKPPIYVQFIKPFATYLLGGNTLYCCCTWISQCDFTHMLSVECICPGFS